MADAAFDAQRYDEEVMRPARTGDQVPRDLRVRYALTSALLDGDDTAFDAHLAAVVNHWRTLLQQRVYARLANVLLAEHERLRRAGELSREQLKGHRRQAEKDALAELRRRAERLSHGNSCISARTLEWLVGGTGGLLDEATVRAVLGSKDIRVGEPIEIPEAPAAALRELRHSLGVLGRRFSLEVVLDGPMPKGLTVLDGVRLPGGGAVGAERVRDARDRWRSEPRDTRTTAADNVLTVLAGECDHRGGLGPLLLCELVAALEPMAGQGGFGQRALADEAESLGLVREEAELLALTLALAPAARERAATVVTCEGCGVHNPPEATTCVECGGPLRRACPSCGTEVAAGAAACARCRFPAGNRQRVRGLLERCDQLLEQGDLGGTASALEEIAAAWPLPAERSDELATRAAGLGASLERLRREEGRDLRELDRLMTNRRYVAALELLRRTRPAFPDRQPRLDEAEAHVQRAERLYRRAMRPGIAPERMAELCIETLAVCHDHEDARDQLRTVPPAPPSELRVEAGEDTVRLTWPPSPSRNVRYVVVRARGLPASVGEQSWLQLARVTGHRFRDSAPEVNVPQSYAVFAEREGVLSVRAAAAATPVLLVREVSCLQARPGDGEVELGWDLPPNVHDVVVSRDGGAPLPLETPTRLHDRGLRNGVRHRYTVRCRLSGADGRTHLSEGVSVPVTPDVPPSLTERLEISAERTPYGRQVWIRWAPPERGTVGVLKLERRPALRPGEVVPIEELRRAGPVLEGSPPRTDVVLQGTGRRWYVPVLILHEHAWIGEPRRLASEDEVLDPAASGSGRGVRVRWTWPDGCEEVVLAWDHSACPPDPLAAARSVRVRRQAGAEAGWCELDGLADEREWFVTIAALHQHQGETFATAGVRLSAERAAATARGEPATRRPKLAFRRRGPA